MALIATRVGLSAGPTPDRPRPARSATEHLPERLSDLMRRSIIALALAAISLTAIIPAASAAPLQPRGCAADAFRQFDMAGVFVSPESQMRVEIYPCGGIWVEWTNAYGTHAAAYYSTSRLPGGGVAAVPMTDSPTRLDSVGTVGFKPGIPGTIEVWTVNQYAQVVGVYTLRKLVS